MTMPEDYGTIHADSGIIGVCRIIKDHYGITWTDYLLGATKGRLSEIPVEELYEIAEEAGVSQPQQLERTDLVAAILDSTETRN